MTPEFVVELAVNTALILIFIAFAEHRDRILSLMIRKKQNEDKDSK